MNQTEHALLGKTVMITGGTGSFGYQMTERLLPIPEIKLRIYTRDEDKQRVMKSYFNSDKIKFILGDVRDYDRLNDSLKNVDVVLHAGALKQIPSVEYSPMEVIKTNTLSAYNIMKAGDNQNVEHVIAISTDKACKPVNSYGMSKALMEKIFIGDDIQSNTTLFSCVRYGNVLGSRGSVLPIWDEQIKKSQPISITSKKMRRFFLTLQQASDLILYAIKQKSNKEIIIRETPALFVSDLASVYAELKTGNANYPQEEIGIRAGEKIDEVLISDDEMYRTKYEATENGNFYKIQRHDKSTTNDTQKEYTSQNTTQLDKTEIRKLIEGLEWKR